MPGRHALEATRSGVRRELARDLHDDVAQPLTAVLVTLHQLRIHELSDYTAAPELERLERMTRTAVQNLRSVLLDLRELPSVVTTFQRAARSVARDFEDQTGISVTLMSSPRWPQSINGVAAYNLIRLLEEALANVRSHSGASRVEVELRSGHGRAAVEVRDDGRGLPTSSSAPYGLGLTGIQERVALLGGELVLGTRKPSGTVLTATFGLENLE